MPQSTATPTISKPPDNQAHFDIDFLDSIPLENNGDNFQLTNILQTIENENNSLVTQKYPQTTSVSKVLALTTDNNENAAAVQYQPPTTTNVVQNFQSTQNQNNFPISLPRMVFQHSTITVNYNFNL